MVDSQVVAVLHGIQDLEENVPGQFILTNILTTFSNIQEEITLRAILENNVDAVGIIHNLEHLHHVGVVGCLPVKTDLSLLVGKLAGLQLGSIGVELAEALDGVFTSSLEVDSEVDNAISASSQDLSQLQSALEHPA